MTLILAIVGAAIGAVLTFGDGRGVALGVAIGALAGLLLDLRQRLTQLQIRAGQTEERLRLLQEQVDRGLTSQRSTGEPEPAAAAAGQGTPSAEPGTSPGGTAAGVAGTAAAGAPGMARSERAPGSTRAPEPAATGRASQSAAATPRAAPGPRAPGAGATLGGSGRPPPPPPRRPYQPTPLDRLFEQIKRWFTTGNVPVKVGVIVSVFGVAFLIKEAVNRQWLVLPIELRLVGVALFGLVLLVIGWRLREKNRVYALSVQGGGIAIIYLVTYASYTMYALLPALAAFIAMLIVTLAAGTLAVLQNARALAILGIAGGFMAPVLTSSGQGNHVVLFSYYAFLNAAIFGIAWFRAWRLLNVLGFLFTFVIGTAWGYLAYRPGQLWSTEPFLILFVLMYTIIPVLFASRQTPRLKGFVDGTLVFGTPVVGFALQTQLVGHTEFGLAISAVGLAALYVAIATYLFRRRGEELRVLSEAFLSLSIVFLAVAVPLALNARWTSVAWSLQGAAMVWLGMRQQRRLALAAGLVLQLGAAVAYALQPGYRGDGIAVLNGYYLGALLIALAALFSSRMFDRIEAGRHPRLKLGVTWALFVWGSAWWLRAGLAEVERYLPRNMELAGILIFFAVTVWLAVLIAERVHWPRLNTLGLLMVPAMFLAALLGLSDQTHLLASYGWVSWPIALATHFGVLRLREAAYPRARTLLHTAGVWLIALLVAVEVHWFVDSRTPGVWALAAVLTVTALLVAGAPRLTTLMPWPVGSHARAYLGFGTGGVLIVLGLGTLAANVLSPGDASPLPYLPVLNPLELATALVCIAVLYWYRAARDVLPLARLRPRGAVLVFSALGLLLLTMAVARTVHHWAGVPFDLERLAESNVLQASLSIVWGSTALLGMIVGARSGRRPIWLAGSILMAVVVAKLFIVELGNTGTVTRVVSFLGVGLLLLVVGYFAPVPPRNPDGAGRDDKTDDSGPKTATVDAAGQADAAN